MSIKINAGLSLIGLSLVEEIKCIMMYFYLFFKSSIHSNSSYKQLLFTWYKKWIHPLYVSNLIQLGYVYCVKLNNILNHFLKYIETRYGSRKFTGSSSCKSAESPLLWSVYSYLPTQLVAVSSTGEADSKMKTTKASTASVCKGISAPWPLRHCHQICTELQ